uniref:Uncharacterized protein n=1 Tax=Vitis vinifera TaxID=29760 RepID=A5AFT3_VITVI|nr:hypothetical protein VITISV_010164 [Vitis vinifera]
MDVSLESKSLPSVGYSRKSYLQTTSQRLSRDKLVHLNERRSLALSSVGPEKLKRPPLPSGCQEPDAKCRRTEFLPGWNELCRKGDRLRVQGVGTPLPDDTECEWLSESSPSGFPKRTCGALPYPDSLKEKHTALVNITPGR